MNTFIVVCDLNMSIKVCSCLRQSSAKTFKENVERCDICSGTHDKSGLNSTVSSVSLCLLEIILKKSLIFSWFVSDSGRIIYRPCRQTFSERPLIKNGST